MNLISGVHLPRRTFLRGVGASVALPFLDAMEPAGRVWSRAARASDPTRLVAIEIVHGAAGSNAWGASQNLWSPAAEGRDFDLTPSALSPLESYRKALTIISNTDVRMAEAAQAPEIGGDHFRSSAVFLTQSHPKQTESSDVHVGTSLDQIYARRFGQDTPIPSMQLCIENVDQAGGCAYGYACAYTDTISWASPSDPLPMIRDPRVAFDQLFGAGGTARERARRRNTTVSILDWITSDIARLKRELGDDFRLIAYHCDGRLVGFQCGICEPGTGTIEAYFVGFEPSCNKELGLYQRMLVEFVRWGLERGARRVIMGRTALEIKSGMGALPVQLTLAFRFRHPALRALMLIGSGLFVPKSFVPRRAWRNDAALAWERRGPSNGYG